MRKRAASLFLLSALAVALAACSADKVPKVESNIFPAGYQDEIIATLKKDVFDKNQTVTVSNAFVSDPALQQVGSEQHYTSCVRYTAHGVYGDSANATRIAYFYGGHLNQLVPPGKDDCTNAAYKPFPALNQVCLGKGCK